MNTGQGIDLKKEGRGIGAAGIKALLLSTACSIAGYLLLPKYFIFPTTTFDALVFTLRVDLFILLWIAIAIGLVSRTRRQSTADLGGAAFGIPSKSIKIKIAFLQNTLEQAFVAIGSHLVFSTLLQGPALSLVVVATVLFAIGRITFYRGYPRGAAARAFGMFTTFVPTLCIMAVSLVVFARNGIAP